MYDNYSASIVHRYHNIHQCVNPTQVKRSRDRQLSPPPSGSSIPPEPRVFCLGINRNLFSCAWNVKCFPCISTKVTIMQKTAFVKCAPCVQISFLQSLKIYSPLPVTHRLSWGSVSARYLMPSLLRGSPSRVCCSGRLQLVWHICLLLSQCFGDQPSFPLSEFSAGAEEEAHTRVVISALEVRKSV